MDHSFERFDKNKTENAEINLGTNEFLIIIFLHIILHIFFLSTYEMCRNFL